MKSDSSPSTTLKAWLLSSSLFKNNDSGEMKYKTEVQYISYDLTF